MAKPNTKRFPWKGSYRSIPPVIAAALNGIENDLVVVAATKKIPVQAITNGQYAHIGLTHDGTAIRVTESVVPNAKIGKYAERNRFGWQVKRTDLPMVTKTFSWETPNFGDASTYGTHMSSVDRDVYQIEAFEPRMFSIKVEMLNAAAAGAEAALIKFQVGQILDRTAKSFDHDLLFCLNLLQESTGVVGVHASDAPREDFIRTIALDWEIFPPGHADAVIAAMTKGGGSGAALRAGPVADRIKLFNSMPVKQFMKGTGNFSAYVGALYADDLVVFENMTYGNALYVLYDDWKDISQRSRLELLNGTSAKFDRFVHTEGWKDRFQSHIRAQLEKRGIRLRRAAHAGSGIEWRL